ncbi:MAG: hypothetical protein JW963_09565 [Anaerolineales bacterium]|nr:hypothetical protein [Anaerolineales bacterium]
MMRATRKDASYLAIGVLLVATLACNISTPRGPIEPTPEAAAPAVTATRPNPAEAPTESNNTEVAPDQASPTSPSSSETSSTEGGTPEVDSTPVSNPASLIDNDIFTSVSVKNGNETYEGKISFPGNDTSDEIYVKPIDFDSEKTNGNLIFTLTCSGRGKAKVNYKGGAVRSGAPGCGETWSVFVINGSPDSQISIRLDASGEVDWSLTVTSGE